MNHSGLMRFIVCVFCSVCLAEDRMLQGFTPLSDTLELGQICKLDKKQVIVYVCECV